MSFELKVPDVSICCSLSYKVNKEICKYATKDFKRNPREKTLVTWQHKLRFKDEKKSDFG